jgi:hypothetical protein
MLHTFDGSPPRRIGGRLAPVTVVRAGGCCGGGSAACCYGTVRRGATIVVELASRIRVTIGAAATAALVTATLRALR